MATFNLYYMFILVIFLPAIQTWCVTRVLLHNAYGMPQPFLLNGSLNAIILKLFGSAAAIAKRYPVKRFDFSECGGGAGAVDKAAQLKKLPLSRALFVEQALVFAAQLNHNNFTCSKGWLARFKASRGINTKSIAGEGAIADVRGTKDWKNSQLGQILTGHMPDNIFNMNESAQLFKLLQSRMLAFKEELRTSSKYDDDTILVAFTVNM